VGNDLVLGLAFIGLGLYWCAYVFVRPDESTRRNTWLLEQVRIPATTVAILVMKTLAVALGAWIVWTGIRLLP
jgi:hypothetical protein